MFECLKCKKIYETNSGLWKHTQNKHIKSFKCKYCEKSYKYKSVLSTHLKTCKVKKHQNIVNDENHVNKEISNIVKIVDNLNTKNIQNAQNTKNLNNSILNEGNIEKLQNCLNNIYNTQNIQNNGNINIYLTGTENVTDTLSDKEQQKILNKRYECINKAFTIIYLNEKYPQYQSFMLKDIKDSHIYKYDPQCEDYVVDNKKGFKLKNL